MKRSVMLFGVIVHLAVLATAGAFDPEIRTLRASEGQDAVLPCGPDQFLLDGPLSFVIWVKDNGDVLYKYPDNKYARYDCPTARCSDNTALLIRNVRKHHAGVYTCRVHFQGSPATDHTMRLIVVGLPGQPKIYNETGEVIDIVGPLQLDDNMTLLCEVEETYSNLGSKVVWQRNGIVIPSVSLDLSGLRKKITVLYVTRDELNVQYTCVSTNADATPPLKTTVTVKMILLPLSIKIELDGNLHFHANQPRVVDCIIIGCVPPPTVVWTLGAKPLKSTMHIERYEGNYTISSLTLSPQLTDHHGKLTCHARNYLLPAETHDASVHIQVGYAPTCNMNEITRLGVVPGDSETAKCFVKAYPGPTSVVWHFDYDGPYYTVPNAIKGSSELFESSFTWKHPVDKDFPGSQILICNAINEFGKQENPCKFAVLRGGPPKTPRCYFTTYDNTTMMINCSDTWDGGRPATLHLEIRDLNDNKLIRNVTDEGRMFYLEKAWTTLNVTASVYATSERGRGPTIALSFPQPTEVSPTEVSEPVTKSSMSKWEPVIYVVITGFGILIVAQSINLGIKFLKNRRRPEPNQQGTFYREPEFPDFSSSPLKSVRLTIPHQSIGSTSSRAHCLATFRCGQPDVTYTTQAYDV